MFFNSNIKFLRKRKGRTQDDVAVSLGIPRSTFNNYENLIAQPGMETLIGFSNYYGVAIDTLIRVDLTKLAEPAFAARKRLRRIYQRQQPARAGYYRGFGERGKHRAGCRKGQSRLHQRFCRP